LSLIERNE